MNLCDERTKEQMKPVALVTGGSRGIGLGIAEQLADNGFDLAINGQRDARAVADVLAELRRRGASVVYCRGDVGESAGRKDIIDAVRMHFGRLDVLVNNAGITSPGRRDILEATEDAFDRVIAVNLKGAYFLTQLVARWMIEQRSEDPRFSGRIIISHRFRPRSHRSTGVIIVFLGWHGHDDQTLVGPTGGLASGSMIRPGVIRTDMTAGATEKYDKLIAEGLRSSPAGAARRRRPGGRRVGSRRTDLRDRKRSWSTAVGGERI
jgi:NAD(P)-dependent dehydrogenase (short-subunit alcohol dehydrogenase family)